MLISLTVVTISICVCVCIYVHIPKHHSIHLRHNFNLIKCNEYIRINPAKYMEDLYSEDYTTLLRQSKAQKWRNITFKIYRDSVLQRYPFASKLI